MKTQEFLHILDEIFEVDPGTVKGDEELEVFAWDSLAMVTFISLADSRLGAEIKPSDLSEARTVADLISMVQSHLE